jgi:hypothetical protein
MALINGAIVIVSICAGKLTDSGHAENKSHF